MFIFICLNLYSIKFFVNTKNDQKITLQAIFNLGVSMNGVTDVYGLTEYQSIFFKTAFHIEDFGIGFSFNFRYRLIAQGFIFNEKDWFIKDDPLQTFFTYMDKIDYIEYGDKTKPFHFKTGEFNYTTFGTGFLVNDFHNKFFLPISRENGFFFKFDGNNLTKLKIFQAYQDIPIDFTFFIPDLCDPDIFALDLGIDIFKFTKISKNMSLRLEFASILDFNATESNRLSSLDGKFDNGTYRNIDSSGYTTKLWGFTFPLSFVWEHPYFRLNPFNELSFLVDFNNNTVGIGDKLGIEGRFLKLKDSGFLLGLTAGFIFSSPHYVPYYFSSNYEIVRKMQYSKAELGTFVYFFGSISLYALNDNLKFDLSAVIPLNRDYDVYDMVAKPPVIKLMGRFTIEKLYIQNAKDIPDLYISLLYETTFNEMRTEKYVLIDLKGYKKEPIKLSSGNGEYFIESISKNFRYSVEIGFKYLGAKIRMLIGVQHPAAMTLETNFTEVNETLTPKIDLEKYGEDMQKFLSLEVSFVL